ncbi:MAG: lipoyl synthase, partial [Armatimonadetes bacterium]|nr:lipoyl synthase [Armatimonadota bacterium]
VEVLVPDFRGQTDALRTVLEAGPAVLNHNIETVRRLQPAIRPAADYERSLNVLRQSRELAPNTPTKSGIIVGLGETDEEVRETMEDLRTAGCAILTIGQYLQPTRRHAPMRRYVPPETFELYAQWGREMGFAFVASAPFVRSSYRAAEAYAAALAAATAM